MERARGANSGYEELGRVDRVRDAAGGVVASLSGYKEPAGEIATEHSIHVFDEEDDEAVVALFLNEIFEKVALRRTRHERPKVTKTNRV